MHLECHILTKPSFYASWLFNQRMDSGKIEYIVKFGYVTICDLECTICWILMTLAWKHHLVRIKKWISFGDLEPNFNVTGDIRMSKSDQTCLSADQS